MRDVAVVAFAQTRGEEVEGATANGVEMLLPSLSSVYDQTGLTRRDIDFWCSGSSDYVAGRAFSFVMAIDAVGAWPPIVESHVEMDGAWALYEAWVKIQTGEADTALVYGFGKPSAGDFHRVLCLQLDPYTVAPLWPDNISLAALQARAGLDAGKWSVDDMAAVAERSRGSADPAGEYVAQPLRAHDCPTFVDGAAVVVLAAEDRARELCERPAWIRGIDHRVDIQSLGLRDLTVSESARIAAEKSGVRANGIEVAELHAPFTHQELILRDALGLGEGVDVNPSGGALAANPVFATGLVRIGEAARRVHDGSAGRVAAHATSGPCLQQNLVCLMEGE